MAISNFFLNAKAKKIRSKKNIDMPATEFEEDLLDKTVKIVRRL